MSEQLFKDRVRERDLDNFLVEELHASLDFRDWLLARLDGRFDAPPGCEVKLQKSPTRLQDSRQTDVQIGWFDGAGDIRARVLIESKVTEDFQPGQAEAYPASSLKERIYALPSRHNPGAYDRCGILVYTATPGAQGTLGGLVATAPRFAALLKSALDRLTICSSDPVCADHEPDGRSGDRATHGAACHSCLLISETSCERRNLFLDRNLLVRTMSDDGAELFDRDSTP